jgi:hypothetical protein
MFSRQLALLLESGTDIVTSLDLLQEQMDNQTLKNSSVRWPPISAAAVRCRWLSASTPGLSLRCTTGQ